MTQVLSQLVSKDTELKKLAERAFSCYLRSIYLMPNKAVFDISQIDKGKFAESLGLAIMPKLEINENESRETSQKKKLKLQKLREKQKLFKVLLIIFLGRKEKEKRKIIRRTKR